MEQNLRPGFTNKFLPGLSIGFYPTEKADRFFRQTGLETGNVRRSFRSGLQRALTSAPALIAQSRWVITQRTILVDCIFTNRGGSAIKTVYDSLPFA
jgi:hypothetical protein